MRCCVLFDLPTLCSLASAGTVAGGTEVSLGLGGGSTLSALHSNCAAELFQNRFRMRRAVARVVLRELKWPAEPVGDCGRGYRRLPHLFATHTTKWLHRHCNSEYNSGRCRSSHCAARVGC
jgi:hypothetical protein